MLPDQKLSFLFPSMKAVASNAVSAYIFVRRMFLKAIGKAMSMLNGRKIVSAASYAIFVVPILPWR